MEFRSDIQTVFGPVPQMGQRVDITGVSAISTALALWKEHHYFATKACWIRIGNAAVVATQWTLATVGDFPLSAGAVYRWTPNSSENQYIAVIEDASVTGTVGYLFIGQSET